MKCDVYYNSHYVSSGGADSLIHLAIQPAGVRHVTIEPRTVAVRYGHTARLRCAYDPNDDDFNAPVAATEVSWTWLINGYQLNISGQCCFRNKTNANSRSILCRETKFFSVCGLSRCNASAC